MQSSKHQFRPVSVILALSACFSATTAPALAQYSYLSNLAYLPYTLSNSVLWPLRNAMYLPYNYQPGFYPNNSLPGRFFNRNQNNQQSQQNQQNQQNQQANGSPAPVQGNTPTYQSSYTDPEPVNDPRVRTRQFRPGQKNMDVVSHAHWADQQLAGNNGKQGVLPAAPSRSSAPGAVPAQPGNSLSPGQPNQPNASSFIDTVNTKFNGDIGKALFDPEARGMARSVGLVPDSDSLFSTDLSPERTDVIRKIFQDQSLDSSSKLDAVKILMRSSAASGSGQ